MKVLCIVWGPFGFRMDELAELVNGKRISITLLYGSRYFAPIRYIALFIRTILLLFIERPDIIFAQNPPIFCPLTCLLYSKLTGKKIIVDHHSIWSVKTVQSGFVSKIIQLLERFVSISSDVNTVPHFFWASKLNEMHARRIIIIHDFVKRSKYDRDDKIRAKYCKSEILAIAPHGGHPLERIENEIFAASRFNDLTLLVTGPEEKIKGRLAKIKLPSNVIYLGLLDRDEYERLKASCDFAICITDEPYTLSHVLFEFAACSLPIISSRQAVVEELFANSILYTEDSSTRSIAKSIEQFINDADMIKEYRKRIREKYDELMRMRENEERILINAIHKSISVSKS